MSPPRTAARTKWWGSFELMEGQPGLWRVGPMELWIRRTPLDWRYGVAHGGDPLADRLELHVPWEDDGELPPERARFGVARTGSTIDLVPQLADRPMVARPVVPFFVPPGETIELFVSTALWIQLRLGKRDLAQVPSMRPSDTWFGGNTHGELCYATRSRLRRRIENVELRPHRAVSCMTVENASKQVLALERLSLPAPQLSLFASPSGSLWTEHVRVRKEEGSGLSEVSLDEGPPTHAGKATLVAPPREPQGRSFGSLIFGGLFETGP